MVSKTCYYRPHLECTSTRPAGRRCRDHLTARTSSQRHSGRSLESKSIHDSCTAQASYRGKGGERRFCIRYLRCVEVEGGPNNVESTSTPPHISILRHQPHHHILVPHHHPQLVMSVSTRPRSISGVPVPKASSRTTRATSKLLADQQQKIAFPIGPPSPSIRNPSRGKVLPTDPSKRVEARPSGNPKDVQGDEEEEEVLRDSVEAAP